MVVVTPYDIDDWTARMARALKASSTAMAEGKPMTEIEKLEQHVRALQCEGQTRGFLSGDNARG